MFMEEKKLSGFEFVVDDVSYKVPSIKAYEFPEEIVTNFFNGDFVPLSIDINILSGCRSRCKYCFTERKGFDRSNDNGKVIKLTGKELEEIVGQFASLGGYSVFICSNGEPLDNLALFNRLAQIGHASGLQILTFTNMHNLSTSSFPMLLDNEVNLLLKLEHLDPKYNDIIQDPQIPVEYSTLSGARVPVNLIQAMEMYSSDLSRVAISTVITKLNHDNILEMREWAYGLGITHFAKHLYLQGDALKNRNILELTPTEQERITQKIYAFDSGFGFQYPTLDRFKDQFSFDVRRYLNNTRDQSGMPIRVFIHPKGVYNQNININEARFGFGGVVVSVREDVTKGPINMSNYFEIIHDEIASRRTE